MVSGFDLLAASRAGKQVLTELMVVEVEVAGAPVLGAHAQDRRGMAVAFSLVVVILSRARLTPAIGLGFLPLLQPGALGFGADRPSLFVPGLLDASEDFQW